MVDQPAEQTGLMTLEEFVRLYEQEGPFEIIEGERVPLSPGVWVHIFTIRTLQRILDSFVQAHQLGEIITEMPFVLTYSSDWVKGSRTPDLMFVRADRIAAYQTEVPDYDTKPLVLVPDLAIEVVSPNDSYTDLDEKVDRYIEDGVLVVWVVDPRRKTVKVQSRGQYKTYHIEDTLYGGEILPGFEVPVKAIFE